ncbi:hypothetical protein IGI04_020384 [Brassica rapa subsp. trilocularis]|uniref:Uncharacterized protein n=1 Tax=Brassica rapa subsp. trilocularis TaxID=1813537 RepID=A0ABQ7MJF5_BRACM|nr:hypothetical protein IGI04_020384 [Brassica rapa subsp. trilocularis]
MVKSVCLIKVFPGGGGFYRFIAAGLVSGEWRLLQIRVRRLQFPGGEGGLCLASPAFGFSRFLGFGFILVFCCFVNVWFEELSSEDDRSYWVLKVDGSAKLYYQLR